MTGADVKMTKEKIIKLGSHKKRGAKRKSVDWDIVNEYLQNGCSGKEVAATLGISDETLFKRCSEDLGMPFSALKQQKQAKGNSLLKNVQMKKALEGNIPMLIWLGKQRLGQRDQPVEDQKFDGKLAHLLEKLMKDEKSVSDGSI